MGDGPGELTDGGTSEAESETDFISEKGKITPRKFSPYEQAFHDDKLEGYTEILDKPLKTPDVLDDTDPNFYPEVFSRGSTLADSNPSDEDGLEGYPKFCKIFTWSMPSLLDVWSV